MKMTVLFLLAICFTLSGQAAAMIDPDEGRSFGELIESRGYQLEEYNVTTADGYTLKLHRVVPPNYNPLNYTATRKPVVLFHGIFTDSTVFFINSPKLEDNIGFALLETGRYDVWSANARGNGLSTEHVNLTEKDSKFWEFSMEHIGLYDIPAILGEVRQQTFHQTVAWVGYSQGGQSLWALLALHPEYANQIRPFVGYASTSYLGNLTSPFFKALALFPVRQAIQRHPGQFIITEEFINTLTQAVCRPIIGNLGTTFFCEAFYTALGGFSNSLNRTRVPVYSKYVPKPTSNWQMEHIMQSMDGPGHYDRYDYDRGFLIKRRNEDAYGQSSPPPFPLKNIPKNFTAVLMYGATDNLANGPDTERLVEELNSYGVANVSAYKVPKDKWSHLDFILGTGAGQYAFEETIRIFDENAVNDYTPQ